MFCDKKKILWAYLLINEHKLDNLRRIVINEVFMEVKNFKDYYDYDDLDIFMKFSFSMIKDLLLYEPIEVAESIQPTIRDKFDLFLFWYHENKENCNEENKKIILESFNLDDFIASEKNC